MAYFGHLIYQNNTRRHGMLREMATPGIYYWFYQKVRNRGPRDYKQFNPHFAAFGNFNFGAAGYAADIPPEILLQGASFAQSRAGTSKDIWGKWYETPPYGDDSTDQRNIREGIEYAIQNGY